MANAASIGTSAAFLSTELQPVITIRVAVIMAAESKLTFFMTLIWNLKTMINIFLVKEQ
jgi:hypothetical protein